MSQEREQDLPAKATRPSIRQQVKDDEEEEMEQIDTSINRKAHKYKD